MTYTSQQIIDIIKEMKKKKTLTKTQHIENQTTVLQYIAQLLVCAFLLGVVIFSLPL